MQKENRILFPIIKESGVVGPETDVAIQLFLSSKGYISHIAAVRDRHHNRAWQMY